jgi:SAM-dependent methyltransferase
VLGDDLIELLGERIPTDHSRQVLADHYVETAFAGIAAEAGGEPRVVDLGCGAGDSVEQFRTVAPGVRWMGVDLERSPEVDARTRTDAEFRAFDGVRLPVGDGELDMVYCKQVLEHVREPEPLLRDVARALRPGGLLAGSTSQLEPFHSLSVWNYTPHGLVMLLERAGLEPLELRPGIDALTLIVHRGLGMPRVTRRYWGRESPLGRATGLLARAARLDARQANAIKLLFSGQFAFLARRAG